ncbi:DNA primase [Candidatus Saccharibacteria bacterium]|nr:DNA primase [Candidatus Saccharibacteria bacterium]
MDAVTEIKSKLSIEDIVAEYVQLKRAGRNFKGLSPFNSEKTPSFIVSPEKQIWHDFSSGKGGDMFTFVQEVEGVDFKGALDILARKAGVDLEQFRKSSGGSNAKEKERLYEAVEWATRFYQAQLPKSRVALEYLLKKRRFSKDTVLLFRLGYSPNTGDALYKFMKSKGFDDSELSRAGLITKRRFGYGDMFRGRVMVALFDASGRTVGFTARTLQNDTNEPKYINTPSTVLYDKGRQAYGLHLAKDAIRKQGFSVVVEGNLDVIASHQAGVKNVVGAAGTALTEFHLKELNRFAGDIRFAFDADRAGISATERAIPLAQKIGVNVSVITLPDGMDPDELIRQDPKLWEKAIAEHKYAVDWLIDRYSQILDIGTGKGKREFTDIVLKITQNLSDKVEQDHYVSLLAKMVGVSKSAVKSKVDSTSVSPPVRLKKPKNIKLDDKELIDRRRTEQSLLALMLMQVSLRSMVGFLKSDMFSEGPARTLYEFLIDNPEFGVDETDGSLLQSISDYVKIVSLQFDEEYRSLEPQDMKKAVVLLQERFIAQYVKRQKQYVAEQLSSSDGEETRRLLTLDKELNNLLRQSKDLSQTIS